MSTWFPLLVYISSLARSEWTDWYGNSSGGALKEISSGDAIITSMCVTTLSYYVHGTQISSIEAILSDGNRSGTYPWVTSLYPDVAHSTQSCYSLPDDQCFVGVKIESAEFIDSLQFLSSNGSETDKWGKSEGSSNYDEISDTSYCLQRIEAMQGLIIDKIRFYFVVAPSSIPTDVPTIDPTIFPTNDPSVSPTHIPSELLTFGPSLTLHLTTPPENRDDNNAEVEDLTDITTTNELLTQQEQDKDVFVDTTTIVVIIVSILILCILVLVLWKVTKSTKYNADIPNTVRIRSHELSIDECMDEGPKNDNDEIFH